MCPQVGIFPWSRPMPHTHQNVGQGGTVNHAHLVNVLSAQHHALPALSELVFDLGCRAYRNAIQNIPNLAITKILFNAEDYDLGADFDADGADSNYIAPSDGKYIIYSSHTYQGLPDQCEYEIFIYKNGASIARRVLTASGAWEAGIDILTVEQLSATNIIDIRAKHAGGAGKNLTAGRDHTYVAIFKIGV